jgi:hypothetical protein
MDVDRALLPGASAAQVSRYVVARIVTAIKRLRRRGKWSTHRI